MKYIFILISVILLSCSEKSELSEKVSEAKSIDSTETNANDLTTQIKEEQLSWLTNFPDNIKSIENLFDKKDLKRFNCNEVERFISYSESPTKEILTEINSNINNVLFGDSSLNFEGFYLYSIQKPIQSFFPITIINTNGAAERPMLLILFDSTGKYVNAIEVADKYGQIGGCMNSRFINDSTLLMDYTWDNYDEDTLGNENWYTTTDKRKSIIHKSGKIEEVKKLSLIDIINRYSELNKEFINSDYSNHNRKALNSFHEDTFITSLKSIEDSVCENNNKQLLDAYIKMMQTIKHSASEAPRWTFGKLYTCHPSTVLKAINNNPDKTNLLQELSFGFENYITSIDSNQLNIIDLRERLKNKQ